MPNPAPKKHATALRVFRVGILGASAAELDTIARVFSVTQYRTRRYQPIRLPLTISRIPDDIDIVLLAQNDGDGPKYYERASAGGSRLRRPIIGMVRNVPAGRELPGYAIRTPLNPAKFLRILDNYTIKELNYFPEFEIGGEGDEFKDEALAALRMLKGDMAKTPKPRRESELRALVVDDSLAVRKQMQIEFELMNQGVDLVDSAEAAMHAISVNRYSIIFLDVVMPGMDGYAACKKFKRSPLNKDTPIVMLTSRSSSFDKFKGTLAGCDAYLVKPINHNDFEEIFRKYATAHNGEANHGRK